jgi:succinate dehydrogenase/fumarate reductase flavoprotein subunit
VIRSADMDVVVIGSGAAGLSAALAARDSGAPEVLVAEAEGVIGGSSRLSGGLTMGLKDRKFLDPVAAPPFYAAEIRPATVCLTACGVRTDRDAQVLGELGAPVPGLFAAGESADGIVGPRYVGSGNSYANCVTFGRIAGTGAARHATQRLAADG